MIGVLSLMLSACAGAGNATSGGDNPGVNSKEKTITIGGWSVRSGPNAAFVLVDEAMDAAYRSAAEEGRLNGWTLKLEHPDSAGDPARSLQIVRDQIEQNKVFAINYATGSSANAQVVPYIASTGVPYVAPSSSGDPFLGKAYPSVFPVQPAYAQTAPSLGQWAVKNLGVKKLVLVYENDAIGQPVSKHLSGLMKEVGATVVDQVPFDLSDVDMTAVAQRVTAARPDAVMFWGTGPSIIKTKQMVMASGVDVPWLTGFFNADAAILGLNESVADGLYFQSHFEPFFHGSKATEEFKRAMKKYYPNSPANMLALSGWGGAQVLIETLSRITANGEIPTRKALVDDLNTWQKHSFSVVPAVSFSPEKKEGIGAQYYVQYKDKAFSVIGGTAEPLVKLP
jgi:branched-chain amino acid transport system substrate-binding protein